MLNERILFQYTLTMLFVAPAPRNKMRRAVNTLFTRAVWAEVTVILSSQRKSQSMAGKVYHE